jgi:hypothetical protein
MVMQRRSAIKSLALTLGGAIVLPTWAKAWSKASFQGHQLAVSYSQEALLAEIVETIIPQTDTIGAKGLEVHKFVLRMVADCYDKNAQETFKNGLTLVEDVSEKTFDKPFTQVDGAQKLTILKKMTDNTNSEEGKFMNLVKSLTIDGYLTSEYVMTNLRIFEMVPGRYHGCVPIKK